jgi:hypothetical protein
MNGFIKLHRQLLDWEWYSDNNTFRVFIHCLLKANYKDKNWKGIQIKRGQFVTSTSKLSTELGLSININQTQTDQRNNNQNHKQKYACNHSKLRYLPRY